MCYPNQSLYIYICHIHPIMISTNIPYKSHCKHTIPFLHVIQSSPKKATLENTGKNGATPLYVAALNGSREVVNLLLEAGDGVGPANANGKTRKIRGEWGEMEMRWKNAGLKYEKWRFEHEKLNIVSKMLNLRQENWTCSSKTSES